MHGESSLWNFSIYDNNNKNVLYLTEYSVTRIKHENGYPNISTKPYTKEEQDIKNICFYIKNNIKYFMKQCLKFRRLQFAHVLKYQKIILLSKDNNIIYHII